MLHRPRSERAGCRSIPEPSPRVPCSTGAWTYWARMSSSKDMFTGLIEAVGHVGEVPTTPGGGRIAIRTTIAPGLSLGESVSVNGVCLTVAHRDEASFYTDI